MARSWLILGAGYTGARLVERLVRDGEQVTATRRAPPDEVAGAGAGARWLALELDGDLAGLPPCDVAVCCAPPGAPPGAREARAIAALRGCAHFVYVSSTGVYAPGGGAWVDEGWPVAPEGELGRARAAAEDGVRRAADAAGLRWTILRAAGIYGPGRGLAARVRGGQARVIGEGGAHVSRIHVEDLVSAILAAAARAVTGVVNCGDDEPAPHGLVLDAVAAELGLPAPPRVEPASLSAAAQAMLLADRRISNRRLRDELGVILRYPSWRDGLRAELASATDVDQRRS